MSDVTSRVICQHCLRGVGLFGRGLCRVCSADPVIREQYTPAAHGRGQRFDTDLELPLPKPTLAMPGSAEKIEILAWRYAHKKALHNPADATITNVDDEVSVDTSTDEAKRRLYAHLHMDFEAEPNTRTHTGNRGKHQKKNRLRDRMGKAAGVTGKMLTGRCTRDTGEEQGVHTGGNSVHYI